MYIILSSHWHCNPYLFLRKAIKFPAPLPQPLLPLPSLKSFVLSFLVDSSVSHKVVEMNMEDCDDLLLYNFDESVGDLQEKLLYQMHALESFKQNEEAEKKQREKIIKHLLGLLGNACKERDEARDQMQKLMLNNLELFSSMDFPFDPAASPDFSMVDLAGSSNEGFASQPYVPMPYNASPVTGLVSSGVNNLDCDKLVHPGMNSIVRTHDRASELIDSIAQPNALPESGNLLQAVMEVPLLDAYIIAGPVPQWKNPPPALQAYTALPASIRGNAEAPKFNHQMPKPNPSTVTLNTLKASHSIVQNASPVILESMAVLADPLLRASAIGNCRNAESQL